MKLTINSSRIKEVILLKKFNSLNSKVTLIELEVLVPSNLFGRFSRIAEYLEKERILAKEERWKNIL